MQQPTTAPQLSSKTQFLRFNLLTDMTALLPIQHLAAVLKIEATQITAIPHLPAWIMGVYNWSGEVLWIVDMGHLLGVSPWCQQAIRPTHYNILLLEQTLEDIGEQHRLGLLVRQIDGIEILSPDDIQSPPDVSEALVPFLRGYWLNSDDDMLAVLNGPAIFDRMPS